MNDSLSIIFSDDMILCFARGEHHHSNNQQHIDDCGNFHFSLLTHMIQEECSETQ